MLVYASPRIFPIVENLAAKRVSSQSPDMQIFVPRFEVLMSDSKVIKIMYFERDVV